MIPRTDQRADVPTEARLARIEQRLAHIDAVIVALPRRSPTWEIVVKAGAVVAAALIPWATNLAVRLATVEHQQHTTHAWLKEDLTEVKSLLRELERRVRAQETK